MNCEQVQSHLVDYLYDELSMELRREVEAALDHCPDCASKLAEMQQVHELVTAVPKIDVPPHVHQNIMREARLQAAAMGKGRWWSGIRWSALLTSPAFATALVVALVLGVGLTLQHRGAMPESPQAPSLASAPAGTAAPPGNSTDHLVARNAAEQESDRVGLGGIGNSETTTEQRPSTPEVAATVTSDEETPAPAVEPAPTVARLQAPALEGERVAQADRRALRSAEQDESSVRRRQGDATEMSSPRPTNQERSRARDAEQERRYRREERLAERVAPRSSAPEGLNLGSTPRAGRVAEPQREPIATVAEAESPTPADDDAPTRPRPPSRSGADGPTDASPPAAQPAAPPPRADQGFGQGLATGDNRTAPDARDEAQRQQRNLGGPSGASGGWLAAPAEAPEREVAHGPEDVYRSDPSEPLAILSEDAEESAATDDDPLDFDRLYEEGLGRFNDQSFREAIPYFDAIIQNAPQQTSVFELSNYYVGQARMAMGDYRGAATNFTQIQDRGFDHFYESQLLLAQSYEYSGDLERAASLYNELVSAADEAMSEAADEGLERIDRTRHAAEQESRPDRVRRRGLEIDSAGPPGEPAVMDAAEKPGRSAR